MMKEIIELLATLDESQNPYIHRVKDKLHELLKLDEKEYEELRIEQSTSRSWEEGATTDLRIGPIKAKERIDEIRAMLAALSGANTVKYEEGHNMQDNEVVFIVTACDVEKLESFIPQNEEENQKITPLTTFIRMSIAGNRGYVRGISFDSAKLDGAGLLDSLKERELSAPTQEWFSVLELLDSLNRDSEINLIEIQKDLKSLLDLKFDVYFHSSSEQFPVDLRTGKLNPNDTDVQKIQRALDSLTLLNCVKVETKEIEDGQKVFIIKQVNPKELHDFSLKKKVNRNSSEEMLSNIIELLKQEFPNNKVIQDLVVFDGRDGRSMTRPYLHIRTQCYHQESTKDYKMAMTIFRNIYEKTSERIAFDQRNEMVGITNQTRPKYIRAIVNSSTATQFIMDVPVDLTTEELFVLKNICVEMSQSESKHFNRHKLFKPQIKEQNPDDQLKSLFLG